MTGLNRECVVFTNEEFIQIEKLATLSFPAHPHTLPHVEDAMAMEQQEGTAFSRGVPGIEFIDELDGKFDKRVSFILERFA